MRVEVVAGPMRYPRTPLLMLFLDRPRSGRRTDDAAALVRHRRRTSTRPSRAAPEPSSPTGGDDGTPSPVLSTSLLTYRRAPGEVAAIANANELADQVDPVYGYLDERSCSSVSVNGRHVTGINETVPVIPASNQKLLVAAVALEMLGPTSGSRPDSSGRRRSTA